MGIEFVGGVERRSSDQDRHLSETRGPPEFWRTVADEVIEKTVRNASFDAAKWALWVSRVTAGCALLSPDFRCSLKPTVGRQNAACRKGPRGDLRARCLMSYCCVVRKMESS